MPLIRNGIEVQRVMYNGLEVQALIYNGSNILSISPITPSDGELIINGNFASGSYGWVIDNGIWDFSSGSAVSQATTPWSSLIRKWIAVTPNTEYTFSIGTNTGGIFLQAYLDEWGTDLGEMTAQISTVGTFYITTPATCNRLRLDISNAGNTTYATFDDISLKLRYPELAINGDFSNGSTSWLVESGSWDFTTGVAICTAAAWSGLMRKWIAVLPETSYILEIGTNTGGIFLDGYVGEWGTSLGTIVSQIGSVGVFNFTTPATCTNIRIDLNNAGNTTGASFDNISIKETA